MEGESKGYGGGGGGGGTSLSKEEMLAQLRKEGVNDLDGLADLVARKAHQDGDSNMPIANSVIIYLHGFVSS